MPFGGVPDKKLWSVIMGGTSQILVGGRGCGVDIQGGLFRNLKRVSGCEGLFSLFEIWHLEVSL